MRIVALMSIFLSAALLAIAVGQAPASAAQQNWYLTDTAGTNATYRMFLSAATGTSNAVKIAKKTSATWTVASGGSDQSSNIAYRASGTWTITLLAYSANPKSNATVSVGTISGGYYTANATSSAQNIQKSPAAIYVFSVNTSDFEVKPDEYLAIQVNAGSKDIYVDVLGSPNSPSYVTSPAANVDDYPGTETISFTITDHGGGGVKWGGLGSGGVDQPASGQNALQGSLTLAIGPETNVKVTLQLKGQDFSSAGGGTIALTDALVTFDDDNFLTDADSGSHAKGVLTTSYQDWYSVDAYTADDIECYHWITIPAGQAAGDYASTFYYQAARAAVQ